MAYPDAALAAICAELLEDWELTVEEVRNLAADLPAEFQAMKDNRDEAAYQRHQESLMESGGFDDSSYRRDMIAAGRGHLLSGE